MMFIHENGDLVLVNVSKDHSGLYQCQTNESGTIRNGSSYVLTVKNLTGNLYGEELQSFCIPIKLLQTYSLVHEFSLNIT